MFWVALSSTPNDFLGCESPAGPGHQVRMANDAAGQQWSVVTAATALIGRGALPRPEEKPTAAG